MRGHQRSEEIVFLGMTRSRDKFNFLICELVAFLNSDLDWFNSLDVEM
jgi:hypothetical protein